MALTALPPCVKLSCDLCGEEFDPTGECWTPHFSGEEEAREWSEECDWTWHDGKVWCFSCMPKCTCGCYSLNHDHQEECEGREAGGCPQECKRFVWDEPTKEKD